METIWKDVKGYEGLYQVSNDGIIKNCRTGLIKSSRDNGHGYLQIDLSKDGKVKTFYVHRLVAEAFIPNPLNLPEVNHKSENKQDNRVENLEYCDHKYNMNYGTCIERANIKKSKQIIQFTLEGRFIREWTSAKEVEKQIGYDQGNISSCCRGKYKQAYGYIWKFK